LDLRTKQRLIPCTELPDRLLQPKRSVFTARYELNLEIEFRILPIFKGLRILENTHYHKALTGYVRYILLRLLLRASEVTGFSHTSETSKLQSA